MSSRNVVAALVVVGAAVAGHVFLHGDRPVPEMTRSLEVPSSPGIAQVEGMPVAQRQDVERAAQAAPAAPVDRALALRDALHWTDDGARIDAIEAAVSARAAETLPVLEAADLRADPEGAPTIILAVARLGALASGDESRRAERTLGRWLNEESTRDGADARGNVSVLVDALGLIGGSDAVDALVSALDAHDLPLHVETLAVENLTALGDRRAAAAIARFAARVRALPPPAEEIDGELREEAIAIANVAVERFSL